VNMLPRLGLLAVCCLVPAPAFCGPAPVRVSLRAAPAASPDADGFITLGTVADLSGGDKAARTRLAGIPVCRAPLSGETRRLTRGDLALKLRQAGCDPDKSATLAGAEEAQVTVGEPNPPAPFPRKEGKGCRRRLLTLPAEGGVALLGGGRIRAGVRL